MLWKNKNKFRDSAVLMRCAEVCFDKWNNQKRNKHNKKQIKTA